MRTTLDISDDVLAAARSLATQKRVSMGKMVSDLMRKALIRPSNVSTRSGIPLLPVKQGTQPVTMEMVNELRDGDQE